MELKKLHYSEEDIFIGFAESRIGGRAENQDSYLSKQTERGFVVTVCDGMGGGPGGKTASTIAVNEIIAGIDEANKDEATANVIIKAIRRANMAIIEAGNETPALKGMGSTATVLLLTDQSAFVAHVGDSRIYQFRGRKKVFRTFDHSMVFDLVKQKVITEEQARLSAQSNVITRALGAKPDVEVEVQEVPYLKGDRFLLCSDGIHGSMPEEELIKLATEKGRALGPITDNIATVVDELGRREGGGHDNLTIALVETRINSKLKTTMSKQTKILMLCLAAVCAISIVCNIAQYATRPDTAELDKQVAELQQKDSLNLGGEGDGDAVLVAQRAHNPLGYHQLVGGIFERGGEELNLVLLIHRVVHAEVAHLAVAVLNQAATFSNQLHRLHAVVLKLAEGRRGMVAALVFGHIALLLGGNDVVLQLAHHLKLHAARRLAEGFARLGQRVFGCHVEGFSVLGVEIAEQVQRGYLGKGIEKCRPEAGYHIQVAAARLEEGKQAAAVHAFAAGQYLVGMCQAVDDEV